jgi:hypothetical protein
MKKRLRILRNWVLQIFLWGSIAFFVLCLHQVIYSNEPNLMRFYISIGLFAIIYVIYMICSFYSKTCTYLRNQHKTETIHHYMIEQFKKKPIVTFSVKCYHFETKTYTTNDGSGNMIAYAQQIRVDTFTEQQEFTYKSHRDTSGVFLLNTSHIIGDPRKYYIKLHLYLNISQSNDGTLDDYIRERNIFFEKHRMRDLNLETFENKTIEGFQEHTLVSVGNKKPLFVNSFWFVVMTIFGLIEIFKLYVDFFCIRQDFTISKEFSTKNDLNSALLSFKYKNRIPSIVINDDVFIMDEPARPAGLNMDQANDEKYFADQFYEKISTDESKVRYRNKNTDPNMLDRQYLIKSFLEDKLIEA